VALADAMGLRPDSAARAAVPLGVQALGRAARIALATGEPAQAAQAAERAAALAGGVLAPRDRLVHARALLQLGRIGEALAYAEKISANACDDASVRAGALLVAGRGPPRPPGPRRGAARGGGGAAPAAPPRPARGARGAC